MIGCSRRGRGLGGEPVEIEGGRRESKEGGGKGSSVRQQRLYQSPNQLELESIIYRLHHLKTARQ